MEGSIGVSKEHEFHITKIYIKCHLQINMLYLDNLKCILVMTFIKYHKAKLEVDLIYIFKLIS